jgi:hypothetical protein
MGPLPLAAACGCARSVRLLLGAGAGPGHAWQGGTTALHAVAMAPVEAGSGGGLVEVAELLLKVGRSRGC